jgi:predicted DNA-binding ribbon-helix-helix protein
MRIMVKRSVVIGGHKTSVSLEQPFWDVVREIAAAEAITVSAVLRRVDAARAQANLSSAVRVYVLEQVRARATRGDTAAHAAHSSA